MARKYYVGDVVKNTVEAARKINSPFLMFEDIYVNDKEGSIIFNYPKAKNIIFRGPNDVKPFDLISKLSEYLKRSELTSLTLSYYRINKNDMDILMEGLTTSNVIKLDLSWSKINFDGIKSLADRLKDTKIIKLNLSGCYLDTVMNNYLIGKLNETKLQKLNLSYSKIAVEGVKILADTLINSSLTHLNLSLCEISSDGAKILADRLMHSKVVYLHLRGISKIPEGCLTIGDAINSTEVKNLDLSINTINDEGIKSITNSIRMSNIQRLDLRYNKLTDDGVIALANIMKDSQIEYLNLEGNRATGAGILALVNSVNSSKLVDLILINNTRVDNIKMIAAALKSVNKRMKLNMFGCFSDESAKLFCEQFEFDENIPVQRKIEFTFDQNTFYNEFHNHFVLKVRSSKALKFFNINYLRFSGCVLTDDDVIYVSRAVKYVDSVKFEKVVIGLEQLKNLFNSIEHSHLRILEIIDCGLGDQHAKIVASYLKTLNVADLDISENGEIGCEGVFSILNELKQSRVIEITLPQLSDSVFIELNHIFEGLTRYCLTIDTLTKFDESSIKKARFLVQCFDKGIGIRYRQDLLEYFQAFEYYKIFEGRISLWENVENREKVEKNIRDGINENLFDLIEVYGNEQKTYFDKIPKEMREMISEYLSVDDFL